MKKIKYLVLLIILALLGTLVYQNLDYFMAAKGLHFNLIVWKLHLPEIQNIAYWGICLLIGLLITGVKGLLVYFRLKKEIKEKTSFISSLEKEKETLEKELADFRTDPYIKKGLEDTPETEPAHRASASSEENEPEK